MRAGHWVKRGPLYLPDGRRSWSRTHAMTSTPWLVDSNRLRIFFGTLDDTLVGSIGYLDVDPQKPDRILEIGDEPVLKANPQSEICPHGVIPSSVVGWNGETLLYYSAFRRLEAGRYIVSTGVGVSRDGGVLFDDRTHSPVIHPSGGPNDFLAGAFVTSERGYLRMWFLRGTGWLLAEPNHPVPTYEMEALASQDPYVWKSTGQACLSPDPRQQEIGFSRPWIEQEEEGYRAWFSVRCRTSGGRSAYTRIESAFSTDGRLWRRGPGEMNLGLSQSGWDSEMVCYPSVFRSGDKAWLFYSGNANGRAGLGFAEWV